MSDYLKAQLEIHRFERNLLIQYHKDGSFNQATIRRLEQELDHEEVRFNRRRRRKSGL
jgi:CPA1 family monovalent cation:H+ antiporter